jgi:hypothetical protein
MVSALVTSFSSSPHQKNSTISEEENEERKTKKLPNSMDLSKR